MNTTKKLSLDGLVFEATKLNIKGNILTIILNRPERKNALNSLASKQWDGLPDEIPKLLEDPKLRKEAIRAVAAYNSGKLGKLLLKHHMI